MHVLCHVESPVSYNVVVMCVNLRHGASIDIVKWMILKLGVGVCEESHGMK